MYCYQFLFLFFFFFEGVYLFEFHSCLEYLTNTLFRCLDFCCRFFLFSWDIPLLLLNLLSHSLRIFNTSFRWWTFTGVCMTASLLMSLGLFWVFWTISTMVYSGWFLFILWFPTLQVPSPSLLGLFLVCQLQLVSPSSLCFTVLLLH